ncbi:MAG: aminoacyl-tRNA hydrolase [Candidatus Levybacteria bacterium]|nr:aminoacyl-tRNA hydrolase [Candidatus Levybacteria bacterium]
MKIIVGLGNPGEKYEKTRHNLGFNVIDKFLKNFKSVSESNWREERKFKSDIAEFEFNLRKGKPEKIILVKPKTYMNGSGLAVTLLSSYFKVNTSDIWIIHDDIDLPLGSMRIRFGGSSGGHKGIQSIIEAIGTEKFWRFRLGIKRDRTKAHDKKNKFIKKVNEFVLDTFSHDEQGKVRELIKKSCSGIEMGLLKGLEGTMNKFNTK